jgi:MFS family permease
VSLIQVAANAPFFVLALPAGALGDILNKRKLLLVTQVAMMVYSALLGGARRRCLRAMSHWTFMTDAG